MKPTRIFIQAIRNYAVFKGRVNRKEYWQYILTICILYFISIVIDFVINAFIFSSFMAIFFLLPTISITIRRIHDVGKSGWFILIPIYNLILTTKSGIT